MFSQSGYNFLLFLDIAQQDLFLVYFSRDKYIICTLSWRCQSKRAVEIALAWCFPEELSSFGTARSCSLSSNETITGKRSSFELRTSNLVNSFPSQWTQTKSGTLFWKSDFIAFALYFLLSVQYSNRGFVNREIIAAQTKRFYHHIKNLNGISNA